MSTSIPLSAWSESALDDLVVERGLAVAREFVVFVPDYGRWVATGSHPTTLVRAFAEALNAREARG